jgi:hypothetical protein
VATVSDASGSQWLATTVGVGATTVTATSGSISGSTTLTVTPAALLSIAVAPGSASIPLGATQQFSATGTYSDGTTKDLSSTDLDFLDRDGCSHQQHGSCVKRSAGDDDHHGDLRFGQRLDCPDRHCPRAELDYGYACQSLSPPRSVGATLCHRDLLGWLDAGPHQLWPLGVEYSGGQHQQ